MLNFRKASDRLAGVLLSLPRGVKRGIAAFVDALLAVFTVWAALVLRLESFVTLQGAYLWPVAASVCIAIPLFERLGLYRAVFRFSGWRAMGNITSAVAIYGVIFATIFTLISVPGVPRTVGIFQPALFLIVVIAARAIARDMLGRGSAKAYGAEEQRILIYGAGTAGLELAAALASKGTSEIVGFLDDDPALHKHVANGLTIFNPDMVGSLISRLDVTDILLAMPSISRSERGRIMKGLEKYSVRVCTMPSIDDLASGRVQVSDIREPDIHELLGRDPVAPDLDFLHRHIRDKVVMVTGAGGSIGSELCRQILECRPKQILLFEMTEFALFQIEQELRGIERQRGGQPVEVVALLGSVQDERRMRTVFSKYSPNTVYHAAAYKHVPLVEANPLEGIRNNVWGTWVSAYMARDHGVENFVLVSTDKAVRPTNIMGASKRLAELVLQAFDNEQRSLGADSAKGGNRRGTCFSMVRFGNVLGSSGSVVPLFRQQIRNGGPITLTHPEVTRFFMTIPEAAQLVIQAGAMARGGDVFLLDMGEPVRVADLARRMVALSGLSIRDESNPDGDIEIEVVGLRPGEKLYEELLIGDNPEKTDHVRIMKAHEACLPWSVLEPKLRFLMASMEKGDIAGIRKMLAELVSGYNPERAVEPERKLA
ncbi:polysaccharide biosynthesis protein [Parvibaculum sp.]|uniref:polysaccharide biosynthesis protein n=1 Tax=Parvibaculum sp. TaxID=2024848 RepID=UPI00391B7764